MGRNPVDDHADTSLMEGVDQGPQVIGGAVAGGGGIVGRYLVTPGPPEGMLSDGQQLHVGEPQIGDVAGQLFGQLPVAERPPAAHRLWARLRVAVLGPPPRAQVDLVDRHGPIDAALASSLVVVGGQPGAVTPVVA